MKTPTKKTAKKSPTPKAHPKAVLIPPAVAGLVPFAMCDNLIDDDFLRCWQAMPELFRRIVEGEGDSVEGLTRWALIEAEIDRDIEHRRAQSRDGKNSVRIFDQLKAGDVDEWTDVYTVCSSAGFAVGLAMGLFLLSNPAPIAVTPEVE